MQPTQQPTGVSIAFHIVPGRMGQPDRVFRSSEVSFEFINPAINKNLLVGERSFFLPFVRVRHSDATIQYANNVMPCHFSPEWSSIQAYERSTGTTVILDSNNDVSCETISKTSTTYWVALTTGQIFEVQRPSLSNIAIFKPTPWRAPVRKADLQQLETEAA